MAGKRSIFEDVGETEGKTATSGKAVQTGMIDRGGAIGARRAIRAWLFALFVLVVVMIVVGGLTRLTESGLSITEWALVIGTLPPMGAEDWAVAFAKYQQTPEFRLVNHAMTLDEFKTIFWWEWGHRFLGRIIGLVWIAGFLGFWAAGKLPAGWKGRLLAIGVLIGVQGAVGWWMVASGLVGDRTSVASYRLALHLGLAFVILGLIVWSVLELSRAQAELLQARRLREKRLFGLATGLMHFTLLQIVLGALVAGIDAGRSYTDWPLMAGQIIPPDPFGIEPMWRNFFENPGLVQFIHRVAGYLLIIFALVAFVRSRGAASRAVRSGFTVVAVVLVAQMVLGIVTVLNGAQLHIAITHQAGAILAWAVVLAARFRAGYPPAQSVRN